MSETFLATVSARHCTRAFLERPVDRAVLEAVLRAAANAPSTRNSQPWSVEVVTGSARRRLADRLCSDFDRKVPTRHDYLNRPAVVDPVHAERARLAADGVLVAKGMDPADAEARRAHLRANFDFYGAPTAMIFHLPVGAAPGTFLEMGLFLQNVMLGLVACGLGSCPQYSVAGYSDAIREELALGDDRLVVCGLSVGHPDPSAPVNAFFPERAPLAAFATWHA